MASYEGSSVLICNDLHRKHLNRHHKATYFNVQSERRQEDSMFLKLNEKTLMVFCICTLRREVFFIHILQKTTTRRQCWMRKFVKQTHRNNATLVQRNAVEGVCRQVTQSLYRCALHPVVAVVKEVH